MPAPLTLPIVSLAPFLTAPTPATLAAREKTAAAVHSACVDVGFFYLSGFESVVSAEEMEQSLEVAREFFGRPEEEKAKLKIKKGDGARGWQQIGQNVTQYKADWHEGLDLYRPLPPDQEDPSKLLHGPNQWPENPPSFRPVLERWIEKMHVIGLALMEATAMGLGINVESGAEDGEWERLKGMVSSPFWVCRAIGYPALPDNAEGISCGAHKDYGNYTLLHADSTPGALQVFLHDPSGSTVENGSRGTWINADPIPGTFVCNVGEMWEILSAGLYKSTLHRVIHKAPRYRVSIPFFYEPNFDALIEPLPSALRLRSQQHADASDPEQLPKPVVYGDFLRSKVSNNFADSA
ncbi:hypothetical protein JCM1840_006982 [Sporobolomyces johnsonii]